MKVRLVSAPAPLTDRTEMETDDTVVPNFRGMTIREVLKKSKEKGIEVRVDRKRLGDRPAAGGRDARAGGPPLHRHLRHGFLKVVRCDFRC